MAAARLLPLVRRRLAAVLPQSPAPSSRGFLFPSPATAGMRSLQTIIEASNDAPDEHSQDLDASKTDTPPISVPTVESSFNVRGTSNLKISPRHDLAMIFTCKVCETRSMKMASRESYEKGVVIARCGGCNNLHLIADRLGWFGEPGSIEDFLAEQGDEVKKAMRCLPFLHGEIKEEDPITKSSSMRSFSTTSMERDVRSGSNLNSTNVSDMSAESIRRTQYPSFTDRPCNLRVFTFSELKNATRNLSRSLMVGEGGFGCVYRGIIKCSDEPNERIEIAVKQLNRKGVQGQKEWLTEMNVLGIVEHLNLVKLIGYCAEDDERGIQRLLVYEYMPNGSVDDHLSSRSTSTLSWPMRLKVALDAARGLKYLHEEMDFQVIFRDLKTSNILLDENWNAKLSDFGLARHGPPEGLTHVSTEVVGTLGYAAPEYMQTGRLTAKSDIWSYGVLLYELITGRRPIDRNRPKGEQKLLEWVKPYISNVKRFPIIVDSRLEGHYDLKSMAKLAGVANRCLVRLPKSRPKMSEVYEMVQKIVDSIETGTPQPPLHHQGCVSEPGAKRTKKGSLKRKLHEFQFGCRRIVWRGWRPQIIKTC